MMANIWNKVKDIKLKPHFIIFDYFFLNFAIFSPKSNWTHLYVYPRWYTGLFFNLRITVRVRASVEVGLKVRVKVGIRFLTVNPNPNLKDKGEKRSHLSQ